MSQMPNRSICNQIKTGRRHGKDIGTHVNSRDVLWGGGLEPDKGGIDWGSWCRGEGQLAQGGGLALEGGGGGMRQTMVVNPIVEGTTIGLQCTCQ